MNDAVSVLEVLLHGQSIGALTRTAGDRTLFAFNSRYIDDEARPTLGLSFKTQDGVLRTQLRPYSMRLMPFFSNLLPEGPLRQYLAERGEVHPDREFFLLWLLGEDLPGALRVRPAEGDELPPAYAREAAAESDGARADPDASHALRFSLAGVQLKFSAVIKSSGGLTIPAKGVGGSWIVKLPSERYAGVPRNEYSMMTLASKLRMNVPRVKLVDIREIENLPSGLGQLRDHEAFAIERFDHLRDGTHVHIEDFAQVFDLYPAEKYKKASSMNIARVLGIETSPEDVQEFTRRLVFNALIGNSDMHVKNWSLTYPDLRRPRLSPAYDFVSTTAYIPDESAGLKFSRSRYYKDLTFDELAHMADRANLPQHLVLETAKETVQSFHEVWSQERSNLPLSQDVIRAVERQLSLVPLANYQSSR
ncbi:MAG TPA: HipA domain-containing protein [Steroidobacteraceae bacterium]|nr:HipA domain-containing protein [Steroidobacteraceae bacterium]